MSDGPREKMTRSLKRLRRSLDIVQCKLDAAAPMRPRSLCADRSALRSAIAAIELAVEAGDELLVLNRADSPQPVDTGILGGKR